MTKRHELTDLEQRVLTAVSEDGVTTPQQLGVSLGVSWQRAIRLANDLEDIGLLLVKRRPKLVVYEITGLGREYL